MKEEELYILKFLESDEKSALDPSTQDWKIKHADDLNLYQSIWEASNSLGTFQSFDTDEAWDSFMNMVDANQKDDKIVPLASSKTNKISSSRFPLWRISAAAACLLLVLGLSFLMRSQNQYITETAENSVKVITLPDNTIATLSPSSTISYPITFEGRKNRIIELSGDATFDVAKNPAQPFIVESANAGIKAVGTVFLVRSYSNSTFTENIEGLIRFFDKKDPSKSVDIKAGESFTFNGSTFENKTPVVEEPPAPEPTPAPEVPSNVHYIDEILHYFNQLTNGTLKVECTFDKKTQLQIDLDTEDPMELIRRIRKEAHFQIEKSPVCELCYIVKSIKAKR